MAPKLSTVLVSAFAAGLILAVFRMFSGVSPEDSAYSQKDLPQRPGVKGYSQDALPADGLNVPQLDTMSEEDKALKWSPPEVPENVRDLDQTDRRLARYIGENWILPPFRGERRLDDPNKLHYSQRGQSEYIDNLLKQKTNGFYIECGAATGEPLSNSLFFEKSRNWSGILIEANPEYFKHILKLRRHAYTMNACLSPNTKPGVLDFRMAGYIGGLVEHMEPGHKARVVHENGEEAPVKIQCFPLLAILRALNVTHVDYFSLDIEGAEYEIMKDFPFDEIQVDVLTIEYVVSGGGSATQEKLKKIKDLMIGRYGYKQETSYPGYEDIMLSKYI